MIQSSLGLVTAYILNSDSFPSPTSYKLLGLMKKYTFLSEFLWLWGWLLFFILVYDSCHRHPVLVPSSRQHMKQVCQSDLYLVGNARICTHSINQQICNESCVCTWASATAPREVYAGVQTWMPVHTDKNVLLLSHWVLFQSLNSCPDEYCKHNAQPGADFGGYACHAWPDDLAVAMWPGAVAVYDYSLPAQHMMHSLFYAWVFHVPHG